MEKLTYSALLALGFNPLHLIQKEKIHIDENIFKRMNQKVGEYMLYFLFSQINLQQTSEIFRDCWPIYDKKMEAQFRNAAFDWFKKLNQSEEFNIKPNLVVSKAVVTPTSNKFHDTVFTLCRIALHSQILKKDPSYSIVRMPLAVAKPGQCPNAVRIIVKLKQYHLNNYFKAVKERAHILQLLRSTAENFVSKYRSAVKMRISLQESNEQKLQNSPFISPTKRETLSTGNFDQFVKELTKDIQDKNDEIQSLWLTTSALEEEDRRSWPKLSSVIRGEKSITYINGEDYSVLNNKDSQDFPFIKNNEKELFHSDGKLDIVSVFQVANMALKSLSPYIQEFYQATTCKDEKLSKDLESQSSCIQIVKEERKEVQTLLNTCLPALMQSVTEQREGLEYKLQDRTDFELCPPTPHLSIDHNSPHLSLQPQYRLIDLTPACRESREQKNDESDQSSSCNLPGRSEPWKRRFESECASPQLQNLESNFLDVSASQLTVDSGCISSCATDTLLQSIERLDVTSKRRTHTSLGYNNSSQYNSPQFSRSFVDSANKDSNYSFKMDPLLNRSDNKIKTKLNLSNLSCNNDSTRGILGDIQCNKNNSDYREGGARSKLVYDQNDNYDGLPSVSEDNNANITNLSHIQNDTPKFKIKQSPLVSQLLKELDAGKESSQSNSNFQSFAKRWQKMKANLSTSRETVASGSLHSSDELTTRVFSSASTSLQTEDPEGMETTVCASRAESSSKDTYYDVVSSLESWLNDDKESQDQYQFKTSTANIFKLPPIADETEEDFQTGEDFERNLDNGEQDSNFNRRRSAFDTVIEAAISGEIEPNLMLSEDVEAEVRRESISISRRESVLQLGHRTSLDSSTLSSLVHNRPSIEQGNIFDESGSFLVSISP